MKTVLFICTGNIFRSLAAERALKTVLHPYSNIKVESAGTHANQGTVMRDSEITKRLAHWGIDGMDHSPRLLTPEILQKADLTVAMSTDHHIFIKEHFNKNAVLYSQLVDGQKRAFPDLWEAVPDYKTNQAEARAYIHEAIDRIFSNRLIVLKNFPHYMRAESKPPLPPMPGA